MLLVLVHMLEAVIVFLCIFGVFIGMGILLTWSGSPHSD
jgi:hypothetical protein